MTPEPDPEPSAVVAVEMTALFAQVETAHMRFAADGLSGMDDTDHLDMRAADLAPSGLVLRLSSAAWALAEAAPR